MSSPIDPQRVRETYAAMADKELIDFATQEGYKITPDAVVLLREELSRRHNGADVIHHMDHEVLLQDRFKQEKQSEERKFNKLSDSVEYMFKQKSSGVSNFDIYAGLLEMGVSEQRSGEMVNSIGEWAVKARKEATMEIHSGIGLVIIGLIAVLVAVNIHFLVLGAIVALFAGVLRMLTGNSKRKKYDAVLTALQQEEEDQRSYLTRNIDPG